MKLFTKVIVIYMDGTAVRKTHVVAKMNLLKRNMKLTCISCLMSRPSKREPYLEAIFSSPSFPLFLKRNKYTKGGLATMKINSKPADTIE
jgi:hypothetical protein